MLRVQEILEYLLSLLVDDRQVDEQALVRKLLDDGYSFAEIESAFASLMDLVGGPDDPSPDEAVHVSDGARVGAGASPRVLTEEEARIFAGDAHGMLVRLQAKGLLSATEADQVVAACQRSNFESVGSEEIEMFISHVCDCGPQILDLDGPDRMRYQN
jgi:uncharacterized protein Smg (DUF494 family)